MQFKDWYTDDKQHEVELIVGHFIGDWFHRFNNFTLLYEEDTFWELFYIELVNSKLEIAKINTLYLELQAKNPHLFKDFKFGNFRNSESITNANGNAKTSGEDTLNYTGYNVEGTYSKNQTATNSQSETNTNSGSNASSYNYVDELYKTANLDLAVLFNNLYKKFLPLFQTIY